LFPFLRGSLFERLLLSLSWQQKSSTITSKRREYHVDCHTKKAAIFFVACEPNPATRVKIPDAMRIKGYSPSKASNQALQMQVCCEAEKIKGEAGPGPPAPVAASLVLALASVAMTARPALQTIMPNPMVAPVVTVGGVKAGILPSPERAYGFNVLFANCPAKCSEILLFSCQF
jgi:hypothetical protein